MNRYKKGTDTYVDGIQHVDTCYEEHRERKETFDFLNEILQLLTFSDALMSLANLALAGKAPISTSVPHFHVLYQPRHTWHSTRNQVNDCYFLPCFRLEEHRRQINDRLACANKALKRPENY